MSALFLETLADDLAEQSRQAANSLEAVQSLVAKGKANQALELLLEPLCLLQSALALVKAVLDQELVSQD
jgi:hypothetical protein